MSAVVQVLRTCAADMTAHSGFKWPESGPVECADWDPTPECGNGLHGLLWGDGDWSLLNDDGKRKWLIVEVAADAIVSLGSKVKFPRGNVVFCGGDVEAITKILCGKERFESIVAQVADAKTEISSGDSSKAASSGNSSKAASSGYSSKAASSGNYSTAASSGDYSKAASSGDSSKAASSGNSSKAASSGYSGIAMVAGYNGRAKAGPSGAFALCWEDKAKRPRIAVGHVGDDGIKADVWYRANNKGELIEQDENGNDVVAEKKPAKKKARK